ncbi:hypothetical protein J6590_062527 [Homalodisca vitripennis]|nr:hypothetical protein J6590_062527 [Homalodisca vitripennis]
MGEEDHEKYLWIVNEERGEEYGLPQHDISENCVTHHRRRGVVICVRCPLPSTRHR